MGDAIYVIVHLKCTVKHMFLLEHRLANELFAVF